jgi:hypothetical protein
VGIIRDYKYILHRRYRLKETRVTLGYTAGYLLIGLEPIRLCTCIVQVLIGRREIVVSGIVDLTVLKVFIS